MGEKIGVIKHIKYAKYVARHKYFVCIEGRKAGLGILRRLLHDWQKLTPAEWRPYVETFYGNDPAAWQDAFNRAWIHHQHKGTAHHWQAHILRLDDGGEKVLEMPDADRREMLADWRAMGRAFGESPPAVGWYLKNREKIRLHPKTQAWVEAELDI